MSLDLKTQVAAAKESLLYLQKQIEGDLARKLMGRESLAEEFAANTKETRTALDGIYEKLGQNEKWREEFEEKVNRNVDENSRMLKDVVTKQDLSSYNDQQAEALNLKLDYYKNEILDLQQKVSDCAALKEKIDGLQILVSGAGQKTASEVKRQVAEQLGEVQDRMDALKQREEQEEGKLVVRLEDVERAKDETEAAIGDIHKKIQGVHDVLDERIGQTEGGVEEVRKACEDLAAKNSQLAADLEKAGETIKDLTSRLNAMTMAKKEEDPEKPRKQTDSSEFDVFKAEILRVVDELRGKNERAEARVKAMEEKEKPAVSADELAEKFAAMDAKIIESRQDRHDDISRDQAKDKERQREPNEKTDNEELKTEQKRLASEVRTLREELAALKLAKEDAHAPVHVLADKNLSAASLVKQAEQEVHETAKAKSPPPERLAGPSEDAIRIEPEPEEERKSPDKDLEAKEPQPLVEPTNEIKPEVVLLPEMPAEKSFVSSEEAIPSPNKVEEREVEAEKEKEKGKKNENEKDQQSPPLKKLQETSPEKVEDMGPGMGSTYQLSASPAAPAENKVESPAVDAEPKKEEKEVEDPFLSKDNDVVAHAGPDTVQAAVAMSPNDKDKESPRPEDKLSPLREEEQKKSEPENNNKEEEAANDFLNGLPDAEDGPVRPSDSQEGKVESEHSPEYKQDFEVETEPQRLDSEERKEPPEKEDGKRDGEDDNGLDEGLLDLLSQEPPQKVEENSILCRTKQYGSPR